MLPVNSRFNSCSGVAGQRRPPTLFNIPDNAALAVRKTSYSLDQPPLNLSVLPGLSTQSCVPWVHSRRAAAAKVGQGSPEHSLANHLCSVSTAQNLNLLFSLKTGIKYANAACRKCTHSTHHTSVLATAGRTRVPERGRCFISSTCKYIERDAKLSYGPGTSCTKAPGQSSICRPDLQKCLHQHSTHKICFQGASGVPQRGKRCSLVSVSNARMCPSQSHSL